ncbi:MAG: LCP family protein [Merdibacter sp.]|nr:LCP family protein [Merdibacter sp.]
MDIDFYAKVNFFSVIEIVDAIGGVDVDVQLDFCEQHAFHRHTGR